MKLLKLVLIIGGLASWSLPATAGYQFRFVQRKSTLCASLLTSVRQMAPTNVSELRRDLNEFFISELNGRPVLDAQLQAPVTLDANANDKDKAALAKRIYGVERTFQNPSPESSVIGFALIEGQAGIDSFLNKLSSQREMIRQLGKKRKTPAFDLVEAGNYLRQGIEYDYSPVFAYLAFKAAVVDTLGVALTIYHPDSLEQVLTVGGFVALTTALGAFDYPIRHVRSYEFGYNKLTKWITQFPERNVPWSYWSRDIDLSKQFLTDLASDPQIDWPTLDQENLRETLPAIFRSIQQRQLPEELRGNARFSIDALLHKDDAGTVKLLLVIRSRAIHQIQKQTQENTETMQAPAWGPSK